MKHSGERAAAQTDTSARARRRWVERLRETPPRARLERALRLSQRVRELTMSDVRRQLPGASERDISVAFVRRVYGERLAARLASRLQAR
jgi:hypothetical protein